MPKPPLTDVPQWYHRYINQVKETDVLPALQQNTEEALAFFAALQAAKWSYRYAEGKWTLKEMLQHIIDTERIFSYRALCFARNEKASLPGFDEEAYAAASNGDSRKKEDLIAEFETLRKSITQLFTSFDEEQWRQTGTANHNVIPVMAIGFIIPGHVSHHIQVIKERYL